VKHAVLTSIGHNIADSLASGIGLLIGVFDMDVFGEVSRSAERFMEVNFLTGGTSGARPSLALAEAIQLYAAALPDLCERQGATVSDFRRLVARYSGAPACSFVVEVEDRRGRASRDRYVGNPGARPRVLDPLGRVRRDRSA
jgi:hypothetical protein